MAHPIVLPSHHIRRLVDRSAHLLVLGCRLPMRGADHPTLFEIHNAKTIRTNVRHYRNGRRDLAGDPHEFTVELLEITETLLGKLDTWQAKAAGYPNVEALHDDWQRRRRALDLKLTVFVHEFVVVTARYMHRNVRLGYTVDPAESFDNPATGGSQALYPEDQERMSVDARERFEALRAGEMLGRRRRSLTIQMKAACKRADIETIDRLAKELKVVAEQQREHQAAEAGQGLIGEGE